MQSSELRSRREKLYLSQAGLAARLTVDPQTVSRWERGEVAIPEHVRLAMRMLALDMEEEWRTMGNEQMIEENKRRERFFRMRRSHEHDSP